MGSPLRGGKGVRGCPLRKKELFLNVSFLNLCHFFCPLNRGGGVKGLSGLSTKNNFFLFAASLMRHPKIIIIPEL